MKTVKAIWQRWNLLVTLIRKKQPEPKKPEPLSAEEHLQALMDERAQAAARWVASATVLPSVEKVELTLYYDDGYRAEICMKRGETPKSCRTHEARGHRPVRPGAQVDSIPLAGCSRKDPSACRGRRRP